MVDAAQIRAEGPRCLPWKDDRLLLEDCGWLLNVSQIFLANLLHELIPLGDVFLEVLGSVNGFDISVAGGGGGRRHFVRLCCVWFC